MPPRNLASKLVVKDNKALRLEDSISSSREATPTASKPAQTIAAKDDAEHATNFKSDLTNIRTLVTCPICDQLLYEPWTLGCGHTYCYSCLCSWFVPNRRKKTCPECRTKVKQMPAPSFIVKQMVEILIKREEMMPPDESIEQHAQKRSEELAHVDKDRNAPDGLFKGTFPENRGELWLDEADGVFRCPNCGHEHEGGEHCVHCGAELDEDGYGFSDVEDDDDLDDLENLELDLETEIEAEFADMHDPHFHLHGAHFLANMGHRQRQLYYHDPHHDDVTDASTNSASESGGDQSDSEDDDNSLEEFVVPDDEDPIRAPGRRRQNRMHRMQPITISDDESDEGGPITLRRQPRRPGVVASASPSTSSVLPVVDNSIDGSEAGDTNSEAEMLRHAGWSPLNQGDDSEADDHGPAGYHIQGRFVQSDGGDSDSESDTGTMVGGGASDDDEDGQSRQTQSPTPTYDRSGYPSLNPYGDIPRDYSRVGEDADDDDSVAGGSSIMDRDGDTEMSVSPRRPGGSRSVSVGSDLYYNREAVLQGGNRGVNNSTGESVYAYGGEQNLGFANEIHEVEDDSSDGSGHPPRRRQPRRPAPRARVQQYDPRISMMLAEHQQSLRGAGTSSNPIGLDEWEDEVRRVEHASRPRRSTSYRMSQVRQLDPLRSTRSPSVSRIISATNRGVRQPRQYLNRYHT